MNYTYRRRMSLRRCDVSNETVKTILLSQFENETKVCSVASCCIVLHRVVSSTSWCALTTAASYLTVTVLWLARAQLSS
jgi:hypothetical protein